MIEYRTKTGRILTDTVESLSNLSIGRSPSECPRKRPKQMDGT